MKKLFGVFLFALLVSTLIFACITCMGEVQAQSSSKKLVVPDFTVKYLEYPYDVPAVEYVDTYTGETQTIPGYHVVNRTIEITIKNQRGYSDLRYNVRYKGHYETSNADAVWRELFPSPAVGTVPSASLPCQSDSEYTVLSFYYWEFGIPATGGAVDIQVEAIAGTIKSNVVSLMPDVSFYFVDELSGWSSTKILTIPAYTNEAPNQNDSAPNPTYGSEQTGSQTSTTIVGFTLIELSLVIILCTTLPVLTIALVHEKRKNTRHKQTA
ncbi:MAG: hypothetical protein LBH79_05435 [Nitrososphaerota archaeon]|jgi:hypothetical protein|nr:hypothetical protein [Nitrososphaerota archaeon]